MSGKEKLRPFPSQSVVCPIAVFGIRFTQIWQITLKHSQLKTSGHTAYSRTRLRVFPQLVTLPTFFFFVYTDNMNFGRLHGQVGVGFMCRAHGFHACFRFFVINTRVKNAKNRLHVE
ncbi:hypothetical protein HOLleu_18364 [Holothuria leucospilota]|uniref:Uncharacterized protein n=1 Tax=Holothuria leucospilota TaxID=206669 RepID=A0A9Q1H9T7_HOLLE|nr:hypothetical protein HOLleu_18364 [Holothuria leucospilota]